MVPRAKEQDRPGFASMNPHADKTRESPCLQAPPEHRAMTIRDRLESRVPDAGHFECLLCDFMHLLAVLATVGL